MPQRLSYCNGTFMLATGGRVREKLREVAAQTKDGLTIASLPLAGGSTPLAGSAKYCDLAPAWREPTCNISASEMSGKPQANNSNSVLEQGSVHHGWADLLVPSPGSGEDALVVDGSVSMILLDDGLSGSAFLFSNPIEEICAYHVNGIDIAITQLREGVRRGYYAAGYMAYECGAAFEARLGSAEAAHSKPILWFGLFAAPYIIPSNALALQEGARRSIIFNPRCGEANYCDAVERALAFIEAGDIYQVNLTYRCDVELSGAPWDAYLTVRAAQPAGWSAAICGGGRWLLSSSPELFFSLKGGQLLAKPMKGTARRHADPLQDKAAASCLLNSVKDRAENLMIVDLLRNDLSRVSVPGSVQVPKLFEVESYAAVHQMTSSITSTLAPGFDAFDVLSRTFPCGSITGAPKIRAMEIIEELEEDARSAYTGSAGFIAPDGTAAFNVLIRTVEVDRRTGAAEVGVGAGIVSDSVPGAEWSECGAKLSYLKS